MKLLIAIEVGRIKIEFEVRETNFYAQKCMKPKSHRRERDKRCIVCFSFIVNFNANRVFFAAFQLHFNKCKFVLFIAIKVQNKLSVLFSSSCLSFDCYAFLNSSGGP